MMWLPISAVQIKTILLAATTVDWLLRLRAGESTEHSEVTTVDLIKKYGYPAEAHKVVTEDDYILELHRIPHGKSATEKKDVPVLLLHGVFYSSGVFLGLNNDSLALLLSDAGYDVWLGNFRGNHYSRAHKELSPNASQFWDFSFHEFGFYDLPASIDYIRNTTGAADLVVIAHSVGATAFLVMASTRPEYQEKVRGVVQMSPVAALQGTRTPLRLLAPHTDVIRNLAKFISTGEIGASTLSLKGWETLVCSMFKSKHKCKNYVFFVTGSYGPELDEDETPIIWKQSVSTSSLRTLIHFGQVIQSGEFQKFDYGPLLNWQFYDQDHPPIYHLKSINTPISLFLAPKDYFVTKKSLRYLLERLKSVKSIHVVPDQGFTHLDFTMAKNAKHLVYDALLGQVDFLIREGKTSPSMTDFENIYKQIVF